MNLTNFLKQTDALTAEYSTEQLIAFIHNIGRIYSEYHREDFLPLWITYLGNTTGHAADRLILEAVGLLNDVSLEVRYAEQYADCHPGLYLNILENGKNMTANDMVSIGVKAMETIPKKYIVRSKAALKTNEEKKEELQKVFMKSSIHKNVYSFYMAERGYSYSERKENRPDSNMVLLLRFLDGQFADILDKGLNESPKKFQKEFRFINRKRYL